MKDFDIQRHTTSRMNFGPDGLVRPLDKPRKQRRLMTQNNGNGTTLIKRVFPHFIQRVP